MYMHAAGLLHQSGESSKMLEPPCHNPVQLGNQANPQGLTLFALSSP